LNSTPDRGQCSNYVLLEPKTSLSRTIKHEARWSNQVVHLVFSYALCLWITLENTGKEDYTQINLFEVEKSLFTESISQYYWSNKTYTSNA